VRECRPASLFPCRLARWNGSGELKSCRRPRHLPSDLSISGAAAGGFSFGGILFPWIVLLVVAIVVDGDTEEIDRRPRGMDPPHQKGAAGGAAEGIRRINVVYFLSRGGRTDHPHLFRVNHHSRAAGVRLRGTCPPSSIEFVRSSFLRAPFVCIVEATLTDDAFPAVFPGSDVKRWLSEIRGKDMPENFSWSYKR
jgi:hypothetical protein